MARLKQTYQQNGFFGIGIVNSHEQLNIGTLWRTAYIMGAAFIFTVDRKYKKQTSDVVNAWQKIPLYHYDTVEQLKENLPYDTPLIAVELNEEAVELVNYQHPNRAVYLLGNEQSGLTKETLSQCHHTVKLPGTFSLNVAVAGSIVIYDRVSKTLA